MSDFMSEFLKRKGPVRKDPETRQTVKRDKWDKDVLHHLEREMKEYNLASKDLHNVVGTGLEAMSDTFLSIFKVAPHQKNPNEVRPSYKVNHAVIGEMLGLTEYEELHGTAQGDAISAGLATCSMEPELERLFNKLDKEKQQAESIEEMLQQAEITSEEAEDLAEALASGELGEGEAKDYQQNLDALNEQLEQLKQDIEQASDQLDQNLSDKQSEIASSLQQALEQANEEQEGLSQCDSWGFEKGGAYKGDPKSRLALAKKLQSPQFQRMSEIIGHMQNIAFTAQTSQDEYVPEEIYDITLGNSLEHILPTELAFIEDDTMALDFMRRYIEHGLLEYDLRGEDEVNKGGIILLEDGSSSMGGGRTIWAKAIGLALLKIAIAQHRPFSAIHFGSTNQFIRFDFNTSGPTVTMERSDKDKEFAGFDAVLNYAETFFAGGTCFMTPLSQGLNILQEQFNSTGSVEGDMVFLTDGQCGVPQEFLDEFKQEQAKLGFKIYGVAIETNPNSEPFHTICDGKVCSVGDLTNPQRLAEVFKEI